IADSCGTLSEGRAQAEGPTGNHSIAVGRPSLHVSGGTGGASHRDFLPRVMRTMPAPASVDELIALVSKSRVVDEKSLQDYLRQLRAGKSLPNSAGQLATSLIRAGLLSHFQAEQLMQGKWRGFFIGRYRVLEQLGAGGMGNVYLGEHAHMH